MGTYIKIKMINEDGILHSNYKSVKFEKQNLWQLIYPYLKKWKSLTAFVESSNDNSLSYDYMTKRGLAWAKEVNMVYNGTKPLPVAIMMPNNSDYLCLAYGCFAVGAPVLQIKHDTTPELVSIMISETKPGIVVIADSIFETYEDLINKHCNTPNIYLRGKSVHSKYKNIETVLSSGNILEESLAGQYDADQTAFIAYSSGTTGNPKGIILSHRAVAENLTCYSQKKFCELEPAAEGFQDSIVANLPFAHTFGLQYYGIIAPMFGAKVVDFEYENDGKLLNDLKKYKPTVLTLRAYIMETLAKSDCEEAMKSVRVINCTGSPPNGEAFERLQLKAKKKFTFINIYGCSEFGPVANNGYLMQNSMAKIIDLNTGEIVKESNVHGELICKSPGLMDHYLNNPEATKQAIDSERWYHTGDIAYFNEKYQIIVIDRFKDIMTVKVEDNTIKVSPSRIERIINQHPSVIDCGVIGIPDNQNNTEIPMAFVIRRDNIEETELIDFVNENAPEPSLRITGGVRFVEELPRNHLGKLVRKFLKNKFWYKEI